jgi:hypothetical protein
MSILSSEEMTMEQPNVTREAVLNSCDLVGEIHQAYYLIESCFDIFEANIVEDGEHMNHIIYLLRTYEEKMEMFLPALQESLANALNSLKPKELTEEQS